MPNVHLDIQILRLSFALLLEFLFPPPLLVMDGDAWRGWAVRCPWLAVGDGDLFV